MDGQRVQKCTVCGDVIVTEVVEATGHSYGEWKIIKEPEIGVEGLRERICTECGKKEQLVIDALVEDKGDSEGSDQPVSDGDTHNESSENLNKDKSKDTLKVTSTETSGVEAVQTGDDSGVLVSVWGVICLGSIAVAIWIAKIRVVIKRKNKFI